MYWWEQHSDEDRQAHHHTQVLPLWKADVLNSDEEKVEKACSMEDDFL